MRSKFNKNSMEGKRLAQARNQSAIIITVPATPEQKFHTFCSNERLEVPVSFG
jgi:hypothetical protein